MNEIKCPLRYTVRPCNEPVERHVIGPAAVALAEEDERARRPGFMVTLIRPGQERGNMDWWGETEHEAVEEMMTSVAEIMINWPEARAKWPRTDRAPAVELIIDDPTGGLTQ